MPKYQLLICVLMPCVCTSVADLPFAYGQCQATLSSDRGGPHLQLSSRLMWLARLCS